jgi:dienelactone hydrolase
MTMTRHSPRSFGVALAVSVVAVGAACGSEAPAVDLTCGGAAPYAARGPWGVGVTTLTSSAGVPIEVWYPASPEAYADGPRERYDLRAWLPSAEVTKIPADAPTTFQTESVRELPLGGEGALPLVLFSHGLAAYRSQSTFLTTHLASWGFVVAAPEHAERGLARVLANGLPDFTRAERQVQVALAVVQADGRFGPRLDAARVSVVGHSAGGGAAAAAAAWPEVKAWVALASGGFEGVPAKPALLMAGTFDEVVPADRTLESYGLLPAGKRLVTLFGVGHLGFADICLIGREQGGVLAVAQRAGVPVSELIALLASDGCRARDLAPEKAWPAIDHYVTAHLRAALGLDAAIRGYDQAAATCLGPFVTEHRQD